MSGSLSPGRRFAIALDGADHSVTRLREMLSRDEVNRLHHDTGLCALVAELAAEVPGVPVRAAVRRLPAPEQAFLADRSEDIEWRLSDALAAVEATAEEVAA